MLRRGLAGCGALLIAAWAGTPAIAQLRIVQYNTGNRNVGLDTIFWGIGAESVNGIARPADVICLQEQSSGLPASIANTLNSMLSTRFGITTNPYRVAGIANGSGDDTTILYRSDTVDTVSFTGVATSGPRDIARAQLRPKGYTSSADFYVYSMHLKASDTTTDATTRAGEVSDLRLNADAIGGNPNLIYVGDMNIYRPSEAGYRNFVDSIATFNDRSRALDPTRSTSTPQNWTSGTNWNNSTNIQLLTQSPVTTARYSGQITGGIDDRFDMQLVSSPLRDGQGLDILPQNYHVFGNDGGSYLFNSSIDNPSNTFANRFTDNTLKTTLLAALALATDHLPVVADYQIPARMTVAALPTLPTRVLRGSTLSVTLSTSNSASASIALGADKLNYTITSTGAASGTQTGTVTATSGFQTRTFALSTATAGSNTASFTVTPTSPGVPETAQLRSGTFVVVDGSNGSFSPSADTNQRTIDFGVLRVGATLGTSQSIALHALAAASGFTADLAVTSIRRRQETTGGLTITAAPLASLAAGASNTFTASVDTTIARTLDVTYQFALADAATVSGGTATQAPLTLDLAAKITSFADLARGTGNSPTPAPAITAPWSPDHMPSLSFPEPLTAGQVTLAPDSLFASVPQFQIDLTGTPNALAAVLSDWTLDGSLHGYTVTPLDADSLILTYSPNLLGQTTLFSWNLTGTNATLAQITSIPEPVGLILSLPLVAVLRRRR